VTPNFTPTPWFSNYKLNTDARVRLICAPYLGGSVHVFDEWKAALPPFIGVYAVQLPGRGKRLLEPSFTRMLSLIEALAKALEPHLSTPFAIFGHSMGALIGFELIRHLRRSYNIQPVYLFVSGSCPPQEIRVEQAIYDLPEQHFIKEVRLRKEIPEEILNQPELLSLVLPALRADFQVFHSYVYTSEPALDCPITAFGGREDASISKTCLKGWRKQTNREFLIKMFDGDHQLSNMPQAELLTAISEKLSPYSTRR